MPAAPFMNFYAMSFFFIFSPTTTLAHTHTHHRSPPYRSSYFDVPKSQTLPKPKSAAPRNPDAKSPTTDHPPPMMTPIQFLVQNESSPRSYRSQVVHN